MEDLKRKNRALLFALALSMAFNLFGLNQAKKLVKNQHVVEKKCLID